MAKRVLKSGPDPRAQKRALARFRYVRATGALTYRVDVPMPRDHGVRCHAGDPAGTLNKDTGYLLVYLDGRRHSAGRVIWLMMTGEWPPAEIDHRDLDKSNNRWGNLRPATRSQNCANKKVRRDSQTGIKGLSLRSNGKYQVSIQNRYVGVFKTKAAAAAAYEREIRKAFGRFANTGGGQSLGR